MSTIAVLPVKRLPRSRRVFERDDRTALAAGMVRTVLGALGGARALDRILVVTRDAQVGAWAAGRGAEVVEEPALRGHNPAAALGVARAVEMGAARVLLVPGDCPLLRPEDVDALVGRHPGPGVVVVPDRHRTGTNALLLSPPTVIAPSFGPGSRDRHIALARAAGAAVTVDEVPSLLIDVDTNDDLAAVEHALGRALA